MTIEEFLARLAALLKQWGWEGTPGIDIQLLADGTVFAQAKVWKGARSFSHVPWTASGETTAETLKAYAEGLGMTDEKQGVYR